MTWVEKLPSGRFRARYKDEAGDTHSRIFTTRGAARNYLDTVRVDVRRGQWIDPRGGEKSFAEWAEQWQAARVIRPTTRASESGRIRNHLLPTFGDRPLKAITPLAVRAWVAELSQQRSAKTVRHCHALFAQMLGDAVVEGLLLQNPCRGTRMPAAMVVPQRFLSGEEVATLVTATPVHYRPLIITAASTGLRWGELAGLKAQAVDLLHRRLQVVETLVECNGVLSVGPPKTPGSMRIVSLPDQAVRALEVAMSGPERTYVFATETGYPLRRHNFSRRVWKPALAEAGLDPKLRFHDLRHTHVALLIAGGVPVKAIQERLGHTSIVTTMDRYGHLLTSIDEALIGALDLQLPAVELG
jgi:integrase